MRGEGRLPAVDRRFSNYRPSSEISRVARGELRVDEACADLCLVLDRCEDLRHETGGAFDAGVSGGLDPSGYVKGWAAERVGSSSATGSRPSRSTPAATSLSAAARSRVRAG